MTRFACTDLKSANAKSKGVSPGELGHAFEGRVLEAFLSNGYIGVQKNKWMKNYYVSFSGSGDAASKREYDLVLFRPADLGFYIIECKAHFLPSQNVDLNDVREFHEKLKHYNGSHAVPALVTDTDFSSLALQYARDNGINLINGAGLSEFERRGSMMKRMKFKALSYVVHTLDSELDRLIGSCL